MKKNWKMMTLIGVDQVGIVAAVTRVLAENGFTLGETSMIRLGGNFTIMLMAKCASEQQCSDQQLRQKLQPVLDRFSLTLHIDEVAEHHSEHIVPNRSVAIHGADRAGIVADVSEVLNQIDFNILDLYSDISKQNDNNLYILHVEGCCDLDEKAIHQKLVEKLDDSVKIVVSDIQTLVA